MTGTQIRYASNCQSDNHPPCTQTPRPLGVLILILPHQMQRRRRCSRAISPLGGLPPARHLCTDLPVAHGAEETFIVSHSLQECLEAEERRKWGSKRQIQSRGSSAKGGYGLIEVRLSLSLCRSLGGALIVSFFERKLLLLASNSAAFGTGMNIEREEGGGG